MGAPLYDITIYYNGTKILDAPEDLEFRKVVNYIADLYHDKLEKYKPPKTGRICVHFGTKMQWDKPNYFGAICSISNIIDENKYLNIDSKKGKYKYILDLLHVTIIEAARQLDWDESRFTDSYNSIMQTDFRFIKEYSLKKSRSRKNSAKAIIEKDDQRARLFFEINCEDSSTKVIAIDKRNWFWYDSTYNIANKAKWISKDVFGFVSKDESSYVYYDLEKKTLETNLKFEETDF